jgi:CRISPR/Cas system-associated endonuclease/helicase Cas3
MLWGDRQPRDWQRRAFTELMPIIRSRKPVVLQACTGAGKTVIQLAIVSEILKTLKPGWVIIISVPKQSLVEQTYDEARMVLPIGSVGRWYANKKEASRVTIVCHNSAPGYVEHIKGQGVRDSREVRDRTGKVVLVVPPITEGRTLKKALSSNGLPTDFAAWHQLAAGRCTWRQFFGGVS